ncbi:MAG: hypothetical protein AAGC92_08005 [Pseudomonadota bacterium]
MAFGPVTGALAEVNSDDKTSESFEALAGAELLAMAATLFEVGLEANDPILVIAAAKLSASVATEEIADAPSAEPIDANEAVAEAIAEDAAPAGTEEMIAAARDLAGDNAALLAMIEDIGTVASRGPTRGTLSGTKRLPPRTQHVFDVELRARERTTVLIDGGNDGNLDLLVYDENGNLVCESRRYGDREQCTIRPRWRGYFRIVVRNATRRTNTYRIVVR